MQIHIQDYYSDRIFKFVFLTSNVKVKRFLKQILTRLDEDTIETQLQSSRCQPISVQKVSLKMILEEII